MIAKIHINVKNVDMLLGKKSGIYILYIFMKYFSNNNIFFRKEWKTKRRDLPDYETMIKHHNFYGCFKLTFCQECFAYIKTIEDEKSHLCLFLIPKHDYRHQYLACWDIETINLPASRTIEGLKSTICKSNLIVLYFENIVSSRLLVFVSFEKQFNVDFSFPRSLELLVE